MTTPTSTGAGALSAPHVLEYTYTRSVGPVVGKFFGGLEERKFFGIRTKSGKVLVPPAEYDPDTGDELSDFVEVGQAGVVTTWAWVNEPRPKHPLQKPFAWALIKLDGADTAMLHVVDAGEASRMATGMRVQVRWRAETAGELQDIVCFEPEAAS
jgi:uncharacterized OB-fold protein